MSIITGKNMAQLFVPTIVGLGLTVFKTKFFYEIPIKSQASMVEVGVTSVAFIITDNVGDLLLGLEQDTNGNFGKSIEALVVEPPLYGIIYSFGKELLLPNNFYKVGIMPGMFEGIFTYATARFFSEPFISLIAGN